MKTAPKHTPTTMEVNQSKEGDPLEIKLQRMMNNKEPMKDEVPLLYTDRNEGIKASTNIRTDRWEIAVEASDKITKSYQARRQERAKDREPVKRDGEPESIQGKINTTDPK